MNDVWLIEGPIEDLWLGLTQGQVMWVSDANLALNFARKEDALAMIELILNTTSLQREDISAQGRKWN